MIDYWPLLGIALVVIGFALRFNPLLVVAVSQQSSPGCSATCRF